jgi:hypothetical protein
LWNVDTALAEDMLAVLKLTSDAGGIRGSGLRTRAQGNLGGDHAASAQED